VARFLLDTHVLLWSLLEPERLSSEVAIQLEDPTHELWLSPISTWEVMLLAEKGRIVLDEAPAQWMEKVLRAIPFHQASLNHEVAIRSRTIVLPHQDPADRFIAASAIVYDLILVTADENLIEAATSYTVFPAT